MWAEIGAWSWALKDVRDRAFAERLPPSWNWKKARLTLPRSSMVQAEISPSPISGMTVDEARKLAGGKQEGYDGFNELFAAELAARVSSWERCGAARLRLTSPTPNTTPAAMKVTAKPSGPAATPPSRPVGPALRRFVGG
jgi:hypothetical protein